MCETFPKISNYANVFTENIFSFRITAMMNKKLLALPTYCYSPKEKESHKCGWMTRKGKAESHSTDTTGSSYKKIKYKKSITANNRERNNFLRISTEWSEVILWKTVWNKGQRKYAMAKRAVWIICHFSVHRVFASKYWRFYVNKTYFLHPLAHFGYSI